MSNLLDTPTALCDLIDYQDDAVVSRTLIKNRTGTLTVFAFDQHQELSEHTAPFDVFIQVIEGDCEVTIGGNPHLLRPHECLIMPADIPHAVKAVTRMKMMVTMIRA